MAPMTARHAAAVVVAAVVWLALLVPHSHACNPSSHITLFEAPAAGTYIAYYSVNGASLQNTSFGCAVGPCTCTLRGLRSGSLVDAFTVVFPDTSVNPQPSFRLGGACVRACVRVCVCVAAVQWGGIGRWVWVCVPAPVFMFN